MRDRDVATFVGTILAGQPRIMLGDTMEIFPLQGDRLEDLEYHCDSVDMCW